MEQPKVSLLKTLRLLAGISDEKLAKLSGFLHPVRIDNDQILFEEGSLGNSLYFIASGRVLISKKVAGGEFKDLAILGPGDCLGEMAVLETMPRSARASGYGQVELFELRREDLDRWLRENPELAIGFFAHLVKMLSHRLRRTSDELALMYDLSSVLLEPSATNKELLARVLRSVLPHLEGHWNACAFLYNVYNEEMDLVVIEGDFDFTQIPAPKDGRPGWIEASTFFAPLPGQKRLGGYLLFRAYESFTDEERGEIGRTLTAVARLVQTAVENVDHRTEEQLRARLKSQSRG